MAYPPNKISKTVLKIELDAAAKKRILAEKYNMVVGNDVEMEMRHMCNLDEGVYENGVKAGMERGIEQGILIHTVTAIRKNLQKGRSIEAIAEFMDEDIEFVRMMAKRIAENASATDAELVKMYCEIN